MKWLLYILKRYVVFLACLITTTQAFVWLFAYEDVVKLWLIENRPLCYVLLLISIIPFAIYDWLEHDRTL